VQKQHREEDTAHAGSSDEASLKRNRTVITCLMILINNPYSVMSKASFDEASRGGQSSSSREQQMNDPRYDSLVPMGRELIRRGHTVLIQGDIHDFRVAPLVMGGFHWFHGNRTIARYGTPQLVVP
jgi:hypothetical protein